MGLPVKRTQYVIYLTSATLASIASIVYTANIRSSINTVGVGWELDAVASVVIGGTIVTGGFGYVLGSVIGALVRSTIDPLTSDFGVPAEWTTIVVGLMILFVVLLQLCAPPSTRKNRRNGSSSIPFVSDSLCVRLDVPKWYVQPYACRSHLGQGFHYTTQWFSYE